MKEHLLLLHGALGSKKQFAALKEQLSTTFEVHTLNFEGHGGNASSNEFSIQLFTENVIQYLEVQRVDALQIFGYSMGGYVALNAALQIPKKIKKIITLGTKFQWNEVTAKKEVRMLQPTAIEEKVPQFAKQLEREHYPEDWKLNMEKTATMMLRMGQGAHLKEVQFKQISTPVVIGIGSLDQMVTYKESEHMAGVLPNATLHLLDEVKHPIQTVDTHILTQFIQSNLVQP